MDNDREKNTNIIENMIFERIANLEEKIDEGFARLWDKLNSQELKLSELSNPATCFQKHTALKNEIISELNNKEDRQRKSIMEAVKIIVGSSGVLGLYELFKHWFNFK
ncbi:MAG: hypothetical protein ACP5QW_03555 [bacterium]